MFATFAPMILCFAPRNLWLAHMILCFALGEL